MYVNTISMLNNRKQFSNLNDTFFKLSASLILSKPAYMEHEMTIRMNVSACPGVLISKLQGFVLKKKEKNCCIYF